MKATKTTKVTPLDRDDMSSQQWDGFYQLVRNHRDTLSSMTLREAVDHFLELGIRCNDNIIAEACVMCRVTLKGHERNGILRG